MSTYNFLGLVNDVNNQVNEVELTAANFSTAVGFYSNVKNGINYALATINTKTFEWPFNHVTQEEDLIPGDVRYYIPRDVKTLDMDSFRIIRNDTIGNSTQRLKVITYEEYLDKYLDYEYNSSTDVRTVPEFVFRTPSLEYGVVPPPKEAYQIAYEYYRLPVSLNLYSDVPSVPENFRHILVEGGMIYGHKFRGDNESSELSRQAFNQGIEDMRTIYINRYNNVRSTVRT